QNAVFNLVAQRIKLGLLPIVVRHPDGTKRDTSLTLTLSTTNGDDAGVIFGCWHDLVDLHCGVDNTVYPVGILRPNLVGVVFTARQHEICTGAFDERF